MKSEFILLKASSGVEVAINKAHIAYVVKAKKSVANPGTSIYMTNREDSSPINVIESYEVVKTKLGILLTDK